MQVFRMIGELGMSVPGKIKSCGEGEGMWKGEIWREVKLGRYAGTKAQTAWDTVIGSLDSVLRATGDPKGFKLGSDRLHCKKSTLDAVWRMGRKVGQSDS